MLDSYFFVPADKDKFLEKSKDLEVDFLVYDLEDAVADNKKEYALKKIMNWEILSNSYIRIPNSYDIYNKRQIAEIFTKFKGRVVLPKINKCDDLELFSDFISLYNKQIIILIETSIGFINTEKILQKYGQHIKSIGFGTHDFTASLLMEHSLENLKQFKRSLIVTSNAFDVTYIDSVDLNINNGSIFKEEAVFAFKNGAKGKFLIHPNQINYINDVLFYSEEEIAEFRRIYNKVKDIKEQDIEVYNLDGVIYEKPHILKLKKIMSRLK